MSDLHDPITTAAELSAKLASRARHVCVLVGAGASIGAGLPDIAALATKVLEAFDGTAQKDDKKLVELLLTGRNLEAALTRLRRIESLSESGELISGINRTTAARLDITICQAIINAISKPTKPEAFYRFGEWASRADYRGPVEIFTTNYDLLIESGLEHNAASYFDGFVGNLNGRFRPDLVETATLMLPGHLPPAFVRLWKLHGSSNWVWDGSGGHPRVIRLGAHAPSGTAVAVFPSDDKYDDSRRVPFVVLMDRFRRALAEPETLLLTTGVSFNDQHLNEIVFEAARRRPRSEFIAFCYGTIPDILKTSALEIRNLTVFGAEEAIIGGRAAKWEPRPDVKYIFEGGRFLLGNFDHLASFLNHQAQTKDGTVDAGA